MLNQICYTDNDKVKKQKTCGKAVKPLSGIVLFWKQCFSQNHLIVKKYLLDLFNLHYSEDLIKLQKVRKMLKIIKIMQSELSGFKRHWHNKQLY